MGMVVLKSIIGNTLQLKEAQQLSLAYKSFSTKYRSKYIHVVHCLSGVGHRGSDNRGRTVAQHTLTVDTHS